LIKEEYIQKLPSEEELVNFIVNSDKPVDKRDIAHKFKLKGQARVLVKSILRELIDKGLIEKDVKRNYKAPGKVFEKADDKAKTKKEIETVIGIYSDKKKGLYVLPVDRRNKNNYEVFPDKINNAKDGDLVVAEVATSARSSRYEERNKRVRIMQVLGKKDDPKLISLIAIHSHSIPDHFPEGVMREAEKLKEPELKGRTDLRHIPLVTIDGADARDFDDAIFAEKDTNPENPGGWHLMVAIADVSFYVCPGSDIDKCAFVRGNSTYFADRVVPMLPEKLSNNLCSLMPNVDRACLACHLWINKDGRLLSHKFVRGLMRSAARLIYEEVEQAHRGFPNDKTENIYEAVIQPLYEAYEILKKAREKRGALEIDIPERKAIIDEKGNVKAIVPRERLDSHQLVEEFMILANVAAAEALEAKDAPCMYRVHDKPSQERLDMSREFLQELGYTLPKATDSLQSKNFNQILEASAKGNDKNLVHTLLLRTQSQAIYSPENKGHFGLALDHYAHFTSPIRRYADLLVHRSLIRYYRLGEGFISDTEIENMKEIGEHISLTERRSMMAERDVTDRFTAQFLSNNIGEEFKGIINGVSNFGLFVTLDETGADGLVPIRTLPSDYYVHDEKHHRLVGDRTGRVYNLAQPVTVRLVEANPMTGSTVFEIVEGLGGVKARAKIYPKREEKGKKDYKKQNNRQRTKKK